MLPIKISEFEPLIPYIKEIDVITGYIYLHVPNQMQLDMDKMKQFIPDAILYFDRGQQDYIDGHIQNVELLKLLFDMKQNCHFSVFKLNF